MVKKETNFAFIGGQNLYRNIKSLGWNIDFKKFRQYLYDKYSVKKAYFFVGYLPKYQQLYWILRSAGYTLCFKEVTQLPDGRLKGNVDAELVLQAMIDYNKFQKAVIVSSDGDFGCLVRYFYQQEKLRSVLSPDSRSCSALLKKAARGKIDFLIDVKDKIEYKK